MWRPGCNTPSGKFRLFWVLAGSGEEPKEALALTSVSTLGLETEDCVGEFSDCFGARPPTRETFGDFVSVMA